MMRAHQTGGSEMRYRDYELDERDDNEMSTGAYFRRLEKIAEEETAANRAYNASPAGRIEKLHKAIDALRHMHYDQGIDSTDQEAELRKQIRAIEEERAVVAAAEAAEKEWDYETTKARKEAYNEMVRQGKRPCDRDPWIVARKLGFAFSDLRDNARRHELTSR